MKSKHDKSSGSNSDRESNGKADKYDSKNWAMDNDDSMSDGGDRSRSGSVSINEGRGGMSCLDPFFIWKKKN